MNTNRNPGIISHKSIDPESVTFSVFTSEDIKELSVTKISSPLTFDSLGHPLLGGLYDSRLGPISERAGPCGTCSRVFSGCPGHFGHIELPLPVVNPLFHKTIRTLLSYSCLECHSIQLDPTTKYLLQLKLQLVGAGFLTDALDIDSVVGIVKKGQEKTSDTPLPDYQNNKRLKKYVKKLKEQNAHLETFLPRNVHRFREKFIKETMVTKTFKSCMYCHKHIAKITAVGDKLMKTVPGEGTSKKNATLLPDETKIHLQEIWAKNGSLIQEIIPVLKNVKLDHPTDVFYLDVIPVPPPCIRPCGLLRDQILEHPQTAIYKTIMKTSFIARAIMKSMQDTDKELIDDNSLLSSEAKVAVDYAVGETSSEKLGNIWQELQTAVDHLLNGDEKNLERGLKQVIEKKEGVIRLHMMGKRVNFAARSVITPDPNLNLDEIGVPEAFAMKLTYPVPVTAWNVDMLRKMVINGPNKHPGAVLIEHEDGRVINIPALDIKKRESLAMRLLTPDERKTAGVKTVHRHLLNGDVLLLNRQPTLHKPSIMAHKARILKGEKTLRLHYANCKSYNADFDGDEMNAHFPQNEIARSEAYNIMDVKKQYLVPKDGTPLSGLIQDHVISGVKLSIRGKFFTKSDYQNLVYQGLSHLKKKLKLLPPTIIKPVQLWSGKQILSTLIINLIPEGKSPITLIGTAKIGSKNWETEKSKYWCAGGTPFLNANCMSESEVIIRNGELLCGVLDKSHYGSTPYSLAHCLFELYGSSVSGDFLSSLAKLFTYHLQLEGFTLGVKDILVIPKANNERSMIIKSCRQIGDATSADAVGISVDSNTNEIYEALENEYSKNPNFRAILDRKYKSELDNYTNSINKTCLPLGLVSKFPDNNLQLMVQSGAKGSTVNTMQISCLLGQIELEGKRPPLMISGKSLPSFRAYDTSPRAGGFIDGRFMTGIQPQEFFFHCMAGREGLIDTAVKTSKSGYLQRCLIKHLEGLKVEYDMTVRDSDNSIIQFAYGEDGMDVSKAQFINKKQVHLLDQNVNAIVDKDDLKKLKEDYNAKTIEKHSKQVKKYLKKQYVFGKRKRISSFTNYSEQFIPDHHSTKVEQIPGRTEFTSRILSSWNSLDSSTKEEYAVKGCPDPLVTLLQPDHYFGVVNENIEKLMESYLKERENMSNTESYISSTEAEFKDMMRLKYMQSLVAPGEPVGLLAAQSIGEPSTQMTLNTFHFAGRGDMNVTLGIPRLREILMTASANLKTPSMDIPFYPSEHVEKHAEKLQKTLSRVTIEDVLHKIDVSRRIKLVPTREMNYILKFYFLPYKMYKKKYNINPQQIVHYMENKFFAHMFKTIMKAAAGKKSGFAISTKDMDKDKTDEKDDDEDTPATKVKKGVFNEEIESSDEEEAADDDDNTQVKSRKRHTECQEYEDPESEEEEHSDVDDQSVTKNNISEDEGFGESDSDVHSSNVVKQFGQATNYTYDKVNYSWCQLNFKLPLKVSSVNLSAVLKSVAAQCVVREVPLIKRAITYTNNSNELILKTEGININEMFRFRKLLDLNRLYSNDIHAIARTYGIEAGCKVIIKEIQNVFNVYGIKVDFRHLSLIADYMTYNGIFEPMSRRGMESSVSPLQQMSFESSLTFLKDATLKGKTDMLKSASSCLMIGQPCKTGTGSFSLFNTFK